MTGLPHPRLLPVVCGLVFLALAPDAGAQAGTGTTKMVCSGGTPGGATRNISLNTGTGRISMPEGGSVFMWGYGTPPDTFQMPGPVLCVNQGQTLNITLVNALPEATSLIFPGQTAVTEAGGVAAEPLLSLLTTRQAAPAGAPLADRTVTYSFTASQPGTYVYESGTNPHKQVHMGLYGALIVRPTGAGFGPNFAYNHAATQFDPNREYLVLMHDIDPLLHQAVERNQAYDVTRKHDAYWTINGRSFPDTIANNNASWLPQQPYSSLVTVRVPTTGSMQPALVRYANAGSVNHPFHPHGNHFKLIAQDGRQLLDASGTVDASMEAFTRTVGAGQTYDLLFRWENVDNFNPTSNPVPVPIPSNRNLTFKDGASYYSGSPYLGRRAALPPGVVSYNRCGEYYFPMHSHALNEFQNFDEGFGGLATLGRVLPPPGTTGCPTG